MIISHHKDPQGNDTIVLNASHINFGAVGTKRIGLSQEFSSHWFVVSKFDMKILSGFYAFLWEVCADRHLLQAWALRECWDSKTVCARLSPSWGSVQFSFLIQKNSTIYLVQQQGSCLQLVNMECSDRTSLAFLMMRWVSFEALCGAGKPRVNRALIIKSHVLSTSLALRFLDAHVLDGHMLYRGWAWMNIEQNTMFEVKHSIRPLSLWMTHCTWGWLCMAFLFLCFAHRVKTAWMKKLWEGPRSVAALLTCS